MIEAISQHPKLDVEYGLHERKLKNGGRGRKNKSNLEDFDSWTNPVQLLLVRGDTSKDRHAVKALDAILLLVLRGATLSDEAEELLKQQLYAAANEVA